MMKARSSNPPPQPDDGAVFFRALRASVFVTGRPPRWEMRPQWVQTSSWRFLGPRGSMRPLRQVGHRWPARTLMGILIASATPRFPERLRGGRAAHLDIPRTSVVRPG